MASEKTIAQTFAIFESAGLFGKEKPATVDEAKRTMIVYSAVLDDVTDQELADAAMEYIKTSSWWPTPFGLREIVREQRNQKMKRLPLDLTPTDCEEIKARNREWARGLARKMRREIGQTSEDD